jgi:VIT1/CCC1 family predicted Fe2+/Mn2+ transporter
MRHPEFHRTDRVGWLRAAVLGANDGIVSTASLIVGVAAAEPEKGGVLVAGIFAVGAALTLLLVLWVPPAKLVWVVSGASLFFLALLGGLAARAGGSPVFKSVTRVTFWGALAMGLTAGVGAMFGARG